MFLCVDQHVRIIKSHSELRISLQLYICLTWGSCTSPGKSGWYLKSQWQTQDFHHYSWLYVNTGSVGRESWIFAWSSQHSLNLGHVLPLLTHSVSTTYLHCWLPGYQCTLHTQGDLSSLAYRHWKERVVKMQSATVSNSVGLQISCKMFEHFMNIICWFCHPFSFKTMITLLTSH